MNLPRRVRAITTTIRPVRWWGWELPVVIIECPRITSKCEGRPDLWEWRHKRAVDSVAIVGMVQVDRNTL